VATAGLFQRCWLCSKGPYTRPFFLEVFRDSVTVDIFFMTVYMFFHATSTDFFCVECAHLFPFLIGDLTSKQIWRKSTNQGLIFKIKTNCQVRHNLKSKQMCSLFTEKICSGCVKKCVNCPQKRSTVTESVNTCRKRRTCICTLTLDEYTLHQIVMISVKLSSTRTTCLDTIHVKLFLRVYSLKSEIFWPIKGTTYEMKVWGNAQITVL